MKFYIVPDRPEIRIGDCLYLLISEEGEILAKHVSSSVHFAAGDLYWNDPKVRNICERKFGKNIQLVLFGTDNMTKEELDSRIDKFYNS